MSARVRFVRLCFALALVSATAAATTAVDAHAAESRPNILVLIADDLGARDLGVYGSRFDETPAIDRLASQGMRFTQAYAAGAVCSPTRASLQTGKSPARTGITDFIPGHRPAGTALEILDAKTELAKDDTTIAEALRDAGYQTCYAGKWHLGGKDSTPREHGYDVVEAEPGIRSFLQARDHAKPFFAVVGFFEPHTPIERHPAHIAHFEAKSAALGPIPEAIPEHDVFTRARQDDAAYASEVADLDDQVGRILFALDADEARDDTIVVFLSDNGGFSTSKDAGPTSNAPLRAGKGWLYEGGIRVPLLIRAPGITKAGTVSDAPVITTDLYPTLLALAGVPLPAAKAPLDGVSLVPLLLLRERPPERALFWHFPHYHGSGWEPGSAVRAGDWKLVRFYEDGHDELYDLAHDPGEAHDRAVAEPEKRAELQRLLDAFLADTGAAIPKPVSVRAQ